MGAGVPCPGDDPGGKDPELRSVLNHYRMFRTLVKNKPNGWNLIRRPGSNRSTDFQRVKSWDSPLVEGPTPSKEAGSHEKGFWTGWTDSTQNYEDSFQQVADVELRCPFAQVLDRKSVV